MDFYLYLEGFFLYLMSFFWLDVLRLLLFIFFKLLLLLSSCYYNEEILQVNTLHFPFYNFHYFFNQLHFHPYITL